MATNFDDRVVASPGVVYRDVGSEAVLLDLDTETYFGLDAVGTRIWSLLTTGGRIRDAVARLHEEYDAPEDEILRDVMNLVGELTSRGLLRVHRD